MQAMSIERKQMSIEKERIVEEVEDEEEEEDESGGVAEDEKKKGGGGGSGRRGSSPPSCQADKCCADLSTAKRYHRRHRVCELHSKSPVVMVAGLRQRFCQQCSRFHELAEFDETKRSCRRRLARHNERRRKSNAETCNEGCSDSKESHCRNTDEWRRIQMHMARSSGYKSFHIR